MATVTTNNQYYTDIANAIRDKNGTQTQYMPSEMAAAITAISGGGEPDPPDDGKTRLYITVPANAMEGLPPPRNQVPLYIQQTVANGVTIDWGDGTPTETLPGTGAVNTIHAYAEGGDYIISLDPAEGCELGLGNEGYYYSVMGDSDDEGCAYCNMLKKAYVAENVPQVSAYSFADCRSLRTVKILNGPTTIAERAFYYCYSLKNISIPSSVTSIESAAFYICYCIDNIIIPNSVTTIEDYAFYSCHSLSSMVISNSVTTIGDYAFQYCDSMKEYHFLSATPPSISGSHVFNQIPSDCIIYVPVGSLQAYQTATNWATYADQIQEEPT